MASAPSGGRTPTEPADGKWALREQRLSDKEGAMTLEEMEVNDVHGYMEKAPSLISGSCEDFSFAGPAPAVQQKQSVRDLLARALEAHERELAELQRQVGRAAAGPAVSVGNLSNLSITLTAPARPMSLCAAPDSATAKAVLIKQPPANPPPPPVPCCRFRIEPEAPGVNTEPEYSSANRWYGIEDSEEVSTDELRSLQSLSGNDHDMRKSILAVEKSSVSFRAHIQKMSIEELEKRAASSTKIIGALSSSTNSQLLENCFNLWHHHVEQMNQRLDLQVKKIWTKATMKQSTFVTQSTMELHKQDSAISKQAERLRRKQEDEMAANQEFLHRLSRAIVVSPGSMRRLLWDLLSGMVLALDVIILPFGVFDPPKAGFLTFMDWLTLVFWTCDVVASCITGVTDKGNVVMYLPRIWLQYLKTWFLLDLITVVPDWATTIMELSLGTNSTETDSSGTLLRSLRGARILRVLRVSKISRLLAMVKDKVESEYTFIIVNIAKLVLMLLCVNHFLASAWYAVGKMSGPVNWIQVHGFADAGLMYRYTTSLHWSLTQFTPGSMAVQPQNAMERLFTIVVLMMGLILFSSFTANITASMTALRNVKDDSWKKLWLLRRFMRQRSIDKELSFRVLRYVDYATRANRDLVSESKVAVLSLLTEQLRLELRFAVHFVYIQTHPLFHYCSLTMPASLHTLTRSGLEQVNVATDDVVFQAGSDADRMFIICAGEFQYFTVGNAWDSHCRRRVVKDQWAVEQCLWLDWAHRGQMTAESECQVIALKCDSFHEAMSKDINSRMLCCLYARDYVKWLAQKPLRELTDVFPLHACFDEMVTFMADFDQGEGERGGFRILIPVGGFFQLPGRPCYHHSRHARMSVTTGLEMGRHGCTSAALSIREPMTSLGVLCGWLVAYLRCPRRHEGRVGDDSTLGVMP
eukprot:TRINITY_DN56607_c0_g1_i1.p1 TRINITY_DN56607_c0_g1~~TRINITY_DN56607_c0_g1_i1.p1  ORF type:complete len:923 (-),score=167.94 TRINITY_DN56607_c0_g1_i1:151-2919(-)